MKYIVLLLAAIVSLPVFAQGDVDSFSIRKTQYTYHVPANWIFVHKTNGLRDESSSNVEFKIPLQEKNVFGTLTLSISEITPDERKERDSADATIDKKATINTWLSTIDSFHMAAGYMEKPTTFKRGKIHEYVKWYYCVLADSIEIAIVFQGQIPHTYESTVDRTVDKFADVFFISNSNALLQIKALAKPKQKIEPSLDSIVIFSTSLVFPELKNWQLDTTKVETDSTARVLQYQFLKLSLCEQGIITVEVFNENKYFDPEKLLKERYFKTKSGKDIDEETQPTPVETKPLSRDDSIWRAKGDSVFRAREHHYFLTESESRTVWSRCGKSQYITTHTVSVYIMNSRSYYTKINFTVVYSAPDFRTENERRNDYDAFVYYIVENTDFEQFYLRNQK